MSTEEFNALPLEARRFIEEEMGCASCGKTKDLDSLFKKYQQMQKTSLFVLRNGAVCFSEKKTNERFILYPISSNDTEIELKEKLKNALKINEVKPDSFSSINVEEIKSILKPAKK
jgi:hypothetical protein